MKEVIFITKPSKLRVGYGQLSIVQDDQKYIINLDDVACVILEHFSISITIGALNLLSEYQINTVFCNNKCMPNGLINTISGHYIQAEILKIQIDNMPKIKDICWQQIVEQKVKNQKDLLIKIGISPDKIANYEHSVKLGDKTNREGAAAKQYWRLMFENFKRERYGETPNNFLNYGYAIIRSKVSCAIIAQGLLPHLGLHHSNRYNAFCLADDLMEPLRIYVDEIVYLLMDENQKDLNMQTKQALIGVLMLKININNQMVEINDAISIMVRSLVQCLKMKKPKMLLPSL